MFPLVLALASGLTHGPATAPPDTFAGWTTTGVEVGGVEMVVQLAGKVDIKRGETVTAVGVLKVRTFPAAVVNGQQVPAATSVVVVGVRVT